jgi:hypothetical protein
MFVPAHTRIKQVAVFLSVEVKQDFQRLSPRTLSAGDVPRERKTGQGTDFSTPIAQRRYASQKKLSRQKDEKL